ncbi:MAG: sodium:solute symporter family protein [Dysgonamonadaceae bacterium]|jgi:SSS family solute:Na+ symporter|nr:sodium:solute symporter family protein [Dysgonamonadaceae bacterium]
MNTLTLGVIIIVYIFFVVYLGYLGYRRTKSSTDFLLGGRKTNPFIMALSYGATFISTSAIVGFGGISATFGMGIQWLCLLNMLMGVIIAFIFFGKRTRKLGAKHNAHTFSQLLGLHYGSRTVQVFIAAIIFIGMPLYAAVVMKGGAVFIEEAFGIDYNFALLSFTLIVAAYVISGGIKGVLYTDALQGIIMFLSTSFLLMWFYNTMGFGFSEGNRQLSELAASVPDKLRALGHQGWTAMPMTGSPQWFTLVTSLILGVGIGCLAQPQLAVRFMMVDSNKQISRGVLIGCIFIFFTVGVVYHIGPLTNLYFIKHDGLLATQMTPDLDKIIPLFISRALPDWFGAVFMLCILSAGMSTLSSHFHTMGASLGVDIFPRLTQNSGKRSSLGVRFGVTCAIVISYIICYTLSANIIARGTALFMGVCAATFLPAYFCSLYWKKANRTGALASLWTGALASFICMVFLHRAEAAPIGICKALTGRDVLIDIYPWFAVDPIVFALPLSVVAMIAGTYLGKRK